MRATVVVSWSPPKADSRSARTFHIRCWTADVSAMKSVWALCVVALFSGAGPAAAAEAVTAPNLVISEVMQNPSRVFDSRGEWFEIHNPAPAT